MSRHAGFRLALLIVLLAAAFPVVAAQPPETDVPDEVQRGILEALKVEVHELLEEKNDDGVFFQRGTYSRSFRPMDDGTYEVGFHKDTASDDRLHTTRYVYTLKQGAAGWEISDRRQVDTYEGLFRSVPDDEEFLRFDTFAFDREGLNIEVQGGSLYRDFRKGDVFRIILMGDQVSYGYQPPMPADQALYDVIRQDPKEKENLVFEPHRVSIECDPVSCQDFLDTAFTGLTPIDKASAHADLVKDYDKWLEELKKGRKEQPFTGFVTLYEPDRRTYGIYVRDKAKDHSLGVSFDNYDPREVNLYVRGMGTLFSYWSEETRSQHVALYDLEHRDDYYSRDYDLQTLKGTVELALEASNRLAADVTVTMRVKHEMKEVPFFVARVRWGGNEKKEIKDPKLTINSVQDANGRELTTVKTSRFGGLVVLPEPVQAGDEVTLRIQYENAEGIYPVTPSFSAMNRGGWLPFVRFGDLIEMDLTVLAPKRYQVLGIGKKTDEWEEGEVRYTRWVPESQVNFPTIIFGDYRSAESKFPAKAADGREIPVTVHVDKFTMSDWNIGPKALPVIANQAANSLNLYRAVFGVDYPFDKLDLVADPQGFLYGQAPSSIVYLGSGAFKGTGTLGTLGNFGGANLTKFTDSLVAHEVGHQWWGNLIANANQRHYWFVESLAEYSAALYLENTQSRKVYLDHVADWRKEILDVDLQVSVQESDTEWTGGRGARRAAIYAKGPYVFHIMRSTWGDEIFFRFLKEMASDLAGERIVTRDIERVAEQVLGGDMTWFFDQWIRGVGIPEYTLTYDTRETEDGMFLVEGQIDQKVLVGTDKRPLEGQFYVGVVPLTIEAKGGQTYQKKLLLEGPTKSFAFKVPNKPVSVELNREGEILAHDVVVKRQS